MPSVTYIYFPGGNNDPVTLGDDATGDHVSGGLPHVQPSVEAVSIAGAAYKTFIEHGNVVQTITWQVDTDHGTLDAAVNFMDTLAAKLPVVPGLATGVLQKLLDDGTTWFYQNCTRPTARILKWDGQSTITEYSVQFGAITQTQNGI